MTRLSLAIAAVFCFVLSSAQAAGLKYLHIPEGQDGPAIDAAMWSPCAKAPEDVRIGSLTVPAVPDCPVAGDKKLPLVVISHGYGGWYFGIMTRRKPSPIPASSWSPSIIRTPTTPI